MENIDIPLISSTSGLASTSSSTGGNDLSPTDGEVRIQLKIQNVVATIVTGCEIDLAAVAQRVNNCEYNPRRFSAAVIMRIREPRTTVSVVSSE